jgi:E3 ubiquitin-protein ligase HERC3
VQTGYFSCALLDNGTVKCWGLNDRGQLGQGHTNSIGDNANEMGDNLAVIALGTGRIAVQLAKGQLHTCVRLDNGTVKCWGDGSISQLGDGQKIRRGDGAGEMGDNLPVVSLGAGRTAVQLVAGDHHTCAILDNAGLKCWGSNNDGNLGLGDVNQRGGNAGEMGDNLQYVNLGTGRSAVAVFAGLSNTCARLDNGAFRCWGINSSGQLLLGSTNNIGDDPGEMGDALAASRFGTGRTATSIAIGAGHICALLDNSTVKCWGSNFNGQLGLGDTTTRGTSAGTSGDNLPAVSLGTGLTPVQVAVGWPSSCALFNDGRVKCWGGNATGQLGLGDTTNRGDDGSEMGSSLPFVSVP